MRGRISTSPALKQKMASCAGACRAYKTQHQDTETMLKTFPSPFGSFSNRYLLASLHNVQRYISSPCPCIRNIAHLCKRTLISSFLYSTENSTSSNTTLLKCIRQTETSHLARNRENRWASPAKPDKRGHSRRPRCSLRPSKVGLRTKFSLQTELASVHPQHLTHSFSYSILRIFLSISLLIFQPLSPWHGIDSPRCECVVSCA